MAKPIELITELTAEESRNFHEYLDTPQTFNPESLTLFREARSLPAGWREK
jgi:hypothetical protein